MDLTNSIDFKRNKNKTYSFDENKKNWLSDNDVQFIYEGKSGILWLATNGGLNKFDPEKEIFTVYTEDDGLPTNYISSILPGENNDLWISSGNGISRMVTEESTGKVTFVNYNESDGLGGSSFSQLVALRSSSGQYYFGGDHGLTEFMPTNYNTTPPELIFTDLKLSNKSIHSMKDDSPIDSSLFEIKSLTLPYTQNNLSFEFAALHYANPKKNQYAHRLKGYEEDWIYDNSRMATYTNLDPGEYVFEFKGTNRDGIWNDQSKSLSIIINPPWWRTTFAYILYGILFVVGIFGVDRFQRRRLLAKTKESLKIKDAEHRAEAAELQAKATEAERRALEAEYEQKKKELDEARELQLSMLPEELPNLPNLDIAVYMQTATEVGGDYYDFHVGMDGTLTVVVGDATGHGMKAGTMVTATKSLFNILAPNPDILATFSEITRVIKGMKFHQLSMCLMLLKIKGNELSVSSAAMPPALIYRKKNKAIEEIFMKGMPLGSMKNFPYTLKESHLEQGDTVLLLSDGLPELKNGSSEMYGYDRTKTEFHSVGEKEPEEIVEYLKNSASQWVNGKEPDDDVTFVVIKVK